MTEAQKLMRIVSNSVKEMFKHTEGIMPILHIVDDHGIHIPVHFDGGMENHAAKDATADIMRKALKAANAQRYAFITEAWMVDGTKSPDKGESALAATNKGKSLEHHPDRIEIVMITVEDKNTKERMMRWYRILRPEHGKPTLGRAEDFPAEGNNEGRFARLFD